MTETYVHGYDPREAARLRDQAETLEDLIHAGTLYPAGARVLEAGCGVGAQTLALVRRNRGAQVTAVDRAQASLAEAARRLAGEERVRFVEADIAELPFPAGAFDHVFLCFVLEHLDQPLRVLTELKRVTRPGGTLTVVEGDHGSVLFHPESAAARRAVASLVALQQRAGGDPFVGRRLGPLLEAAGFTGVRVAPRLVHADARRPDLARGFVELTFTAMVEGVGEAAVAAGLASPDDFARGIADLRRTAEPDGTFCYLFFKAVGRVP